MSKIEVFPHDPRWQDEFEKEVGFIAAALGDNVTAVHHVGSTAIPDIYAKPVIDILAEVKKISDVDSRGLRMESLGYQVMGEFGIPGRRYFRKDDENGTRTHQVHVFEADSEEAIRHLVFRDFIVAHPDEAHSYSDLKRRLAAAHPDDPEAYMDGKDAFIKEIDRRADKWRRSNA